MNRRQFVAAALAASGSSLLPERANADISTQDSAATHDSPASGMGASQPPTASTRKRPTA